MLYVVICRLHRAFFWSVGRLFIKYFVNPCKVCKYMRTSMIEMIGYIPKPSDDSGELGSNTSI